MSAKNRRRAMSGINVVPYIDVMLVLLIIFMITAPIVQQGVEIELPKAAANSLPPEEREPVILSVSRNGEYFINIGDNLKKPVSDDEVVKRVGIVMRQHPQTSVLVRGDTAVDYGSVTRAMVLLQSAGVEKVGLMT
ncbi:MAG TPA: protein TolR, partial [Thiotrichales bacterium]|nr:protein TolR [Thiotrichales bacterium]